MKAFAIALALLGFACSTPAPAPYTECELAGDCSVQVMDEHHEDEEHEGHEHAAATVAPPPKTGLDDGPWHAIRVCIEDVPSAVRPEVEAAVMAWASSTASWREWRIVTTNCTVTIAEVGKYANVCARTTAAGCVDSIGALATRTGKGRLFLYAGNYERFARGTVMHELGHLLGLTHRDGTVMQAGWDQSYRNAEWECPDAVSIDRLETKLGVQGFTACAMPDGL